MIFQLCRAGLATTIGTIAGQAKSNPRAKTCLTTLFRTYFSTSRLDYGKYGTPANYRVFKKNYFEVGVDESYRTIWAYEFLTPHMVQGKVKRGTIKFQEENKLPLHVRTTLKDYKGSGYARGHLAAAANYTFSKEAIRETFVLSNACPQNGYLNSGYWLLLEKTVRTWLDTVPNLHIITGPLYMYEKSFTWIETARPQVIGENKIPVPTHFFKVILSESQNGDLQMRAYVAPNQQTPPKLSPNNFLTTVEKVERIAGLSFFPKIDEKKGEQLKKTLHRDLD